MSARARWVGRFVSVSLAATWLCAGCGVAPVPDREPGVRAPLTRACDEGDPFRCALPWPSSAFVRSDASTATGLRLALDPEALPGEDPSTLDLADGFSRVSPLVAGFPMPLEVESGAVGSELAVRLFVAQPDHPQYGQSVPLRLDAYPHRGETLLFGYPTRPLDANTDYVVVVLDDLRAADGASLETPRAVHVALEEKAPATSEEEAIRAYHAPTRDLLEAVGVDFGRVLRVWDFTTRSEEDPRRWLVAMRQAGLDALARGEVDVVVDEVRAASFESGALIVRGRLLGVPAFAGEEGFALDDAGMPVAQGTTETPFRFTVPAGSGDYGVVVHAHGTGGSWLNGHFDAEVTELGFARLGVHVRGWNGDENLELFGNMVPVLRGAEASTAGLLQSIVEACVLIAAMDDGPLATTLSADSLGDAPNPAAGRRPDPSLLAFTGISMGASSGATLVAAEERLPYAALLVPGAAWTNMVWRSVAFELVLTLNRARIPNELDMMIALAASQSLWDPMDAASWGEPLREGHLLMLAQSMGDQLMPAAGTHMLAAATGARQLGAVLGPVPDVEPATGPITTGAALTQYRSAGTSVGEVHDFATTGGAAGDAVREQLVSFLRSIRDGAPSIGLPSACVGGSCDFRAP